jgi:Leucine Rich repeat
MPRNDKRKQGSSPEKHAPTQERRAKRTSLGPESKNGAEVTTLPTLDSSINPIKTEAPDKFDDQNQHSDDESTMLQVDDELVLDLTAETEDYHVVLQRARDTALNGKIQDFTMVSHLSRAFPVRDLADILMKTKNLESLSLFSIALSGDTEDFNVLAQVLGGHKRLREVHFIDCGMLGVWKNPDSSDSTSTTRSRPLQQMPPSFASESTSTTLSRPLQQLTPIFASRPKIVRAVKSALAGPTDTSTLGAPTDMSTSGGTAAMSTSAATAKSASGATAMSISTLGDFRARKLETSSSARGEAAHSTARASEAPSVDSKTSCSKESWESSKRSKGSSKSKRSKGSLSTKMSAWPPVPTMDAILNALASIVSLTNVELFGIPRKKFDKLSDGDGESGHQAIVREGEGDRDLPMVPMNDDDSSTHSDDDFLDDYDGDIRGIPVNGRRGCSATEKLSLLMSPESIGELCKAPALTNIGLEDLRLTPQHIVLIAEALSRGSCEVEELKMRGCNIDDRSSLALAKMLAVNTSLAKLDLSYNHIGDKGCIAISSALHDNKTLKCLNLMGNECADDYDKESQGGCYEAMMGLLKKNDTLTDLILEPFEQDNDSTDDIPEFIFIPNNIQEAEEASSASSD